MNPPGRSIEIRVLNLIRKREHYLTFRKMLRPEFFTGQPTQTLYSEIDKFYSAHSAPKVRVSDLYALCKVKHRDEKDLVEVKGVLKDMQKLGDEDPSPTKAIVVEWAKRSLLKEALYEGLDQIERANGLDLDVIRDKIDLAATMGLEDETRYSYFRLYKTRLDEKSIVDPIASGLPTVDEALEGGLDKGEIGLFIGPTHRGKTRALVNVGAHALELGKRVVHFIVCDSTATRVARRYDSVLTNEIYSSLRDDPKSLIVHLKRIKRAGGHLTIKEYDRFAPTPNDLRHWLKEHIEMIKESPDLIVLDYLDELKSDRHYKDYRFESRDVTSAVRRLGAEFGCPIWTASQGNRGSMAKRLVGLDDVAEDVWKVNQADVVITINQSEEEKEENIVRYRLAKARREMFFPKVVFCEVSDAGKVTESGENYGPRT